MGFPFTGKVLIIAMLPASHSPTQIVKFEFVPPPEDATDVRKRAFPGCQKGGGGPVLGPHPVVVSAVASTVPVPFSPEAPAAEGFETVNVPEIAASTKKVPLFAEFDMPVITTLLPACGGRAELSV